MDEKIILTVGQTKFTDENLMVIGEDLASLWGGCCIEYKVEQSESLVRFFCKEAGENFFCDITFDDLIERFDKIKRYSK